VIRVTQHAAGQSPASLTIAGTLKLAVPIAISVQYLNSLMLSLRTSAPPPRQQEERSGTDIG
jgi:hypothetical protein